MRLTVNVRFATYRDVNCTTGIPDSVSASDAGFYSCGATSASGSNLARSELRLASPEEDGGEDGEVSTPPVIQLGPANQTLAEGATARSAPSFLG